MVESRTRGQCLKIRGHPFMTGEIVALRIENLWNSVPEKVETEPLNIFKVEVD